MTNRVAVVTGGFGALGSVVARHALDAGYRVAAVDLSPSPTQPSAGDMLCLGGVDLTDAEVAVAIMDRIAEALGGLDVLFNVAGGFVWQTVADGDPAIWARMHAINLTTALNASRAALPRLLAGGSGRIVNVGANSAVRADAGMGAYAAAKGAVHRLTESLAVETRGRGVTVNAVLPSIIDTPANRADMPDADASGWVTPDDLAAVMLFLASPRASAVTGALVPVVGGL
ncbi:MAG: SDR family NAD(P)-dependent oxidoreductase [Caulobacter sp.]|nr:SDR family NAD(P)-dependent oxidoreductase [Caulobacter sp.]